MFYSAITYIGQGSSFPQGAVDFHFRDHLGNIRMVLEETGRDLYTATQMADYYPFGLTFYDGENRGVSSLTQSRYL